MDLTILGHIEISWVQRDHEWAKVLSGFYWMGKVCGACFTIFSSGIAQALPCPYGETSQRDSGVFSSQPLPTPAVYCLYFVLFLRAPGQQIPQWECVVRSSSWARSSPDSPSHDASIAKCLFYTCHLALGVPYFPSHSRDWTTWPHMCRKVLEVTVSPLLNVRLDLLTYIVTALGEAFWDCSDCSRGNPEMVCNVQSITLLGLNFMQHLAVKIWENLGLLIFLLWFEETLVSHF